MSQSGTPASTLAETVQRRNRIGEVLRGMIKFARSKPLGAFSAFLVFLVLFCALFADIVAPYGKLEMYTGAKLDSPSFGHPLGTDQFGRDLLSRVIYGARISAIIGLGSTGIGSSAAFILGCMSGYFGGRFDTIMQRVVDSVMAIPSLILLLSILSVIGSGMFQIIAALSFRRMWTESRTIRGASLSIAQNQYVEAGRAIGASNYRIITRYIMPNVFAPAIIVFTVATGGAILAEASLSFLGYGIPPPEPSWGGMLASDGRQYMVHSPWMLLAPLLALSFTIFGINMFGDALRDIMDPRLRGSQGARMAQ